MLLVVGCEKAPSGVSTGTSIKAVKVKKAGYELQFSDSFNVGMNRVDDFGISVSLIVDVSGSMNESPRSGGNKKSIQATDALLTIIEYIESISEKQKDLKINVSVLKFGSYVNEVYPLTTMTKEEFLKLKGLCTYKMFAPSDGTAIGKALEKGSEVLAQSGTILNSMILISDGENSVGISPEPVLQGIYADNNNKSTPDFVVNTSTQLISFIGFDVGSNVFDGIKQYGARVSSAGNQIELEESLKALLEADITKLESN